MTNKIDSSYSTFHFLIKSQFIKFQCQYLWDLSVLDDVSPLGTVVGVYLFLFLGFIFSMAWIKLSDEKKKS